MLCAVDDRYRFARGELLARGQETGCIWLQVDTAQRDDPGAVVSEEGQFDNERGTEWHVGCGSMVDRMANRMEG